MSVILLKCGIKNISTFPWHFNNNNPHIIRIGTSIDVISGHDTSIPYDGNNDNHS